jgi:hypothetical protein
MSSVAMLDSALVATGDTVRRRPRAVEVSDAYELRLRIHRYASYATIPLFVAQTVAGNQMYVNGGPTPQWASTLHSAGAAGLGALFAVNTVTGAWNLWESRTEPGAKRRWVHGLLMLAADAGFAATAALGPNRRSPDFENGRSTHRAVAFTSIGLGTAGYLTMLLGGL